MMNQDSNEVQTMERNPKVHDSAAGNSSENRTQSKQVALEKLRNMEWKRNKQDPWHLARLNSGGNNVQERMKSSKDENYFEGTGVQKTKKLRKPPRVVEGSPAAPPGFNVAPPPPQVNAWTQKKGSSLFQKTDENDEEDPVMKLVLEESLRSAKEDEIRRLERMKMTNLDLPTTSQAMIAEKDWEVECKDENELYLKLGLGGSDLPKSTTIQENPVQEEQPVIQAIEIDIKGESPLANKIHRSSIFHRTRKTSPKERLNSSCPNQKIDSAKSVRKEPCFKVDKHNCSTEDINSSSPENDEPDSDDSFKHSPPLPKCSKSIKQVSETVSILSSYTTETNPNVLQRTLVKYPNNVPVNDELAQFNSAVTIRDTQGSTETMADNTKLKSTIAKKNESETSKPKNSEKMSNDPCEYSETDILLHNFIRHEPPSNMNYVSQSNIPDISSVKITDSNAFFNQPISPTIISQNLNMAQHFISPQMATTEQRPVLNSLIGSVFPTGVQTSIGQDTSPSVSVSHLQNITPFGSLEKEIPSIVGSAVHLPTHAQNVAYSHPYSLDQESLTSALNKEYASASAPIRGMLSVHPVRGHPQYEYTNSNIIVPSFSGQISPLLFQQQLQQAQLQHLQLLALNNAQIQHSQLSNSIVDTDENTRDEQVINQSQIQNSNNLLAQTPRMQISSQVPQAQILSHASHILSQAQAQVFSQNKPQTFPQSQPNLVHLQNHPQVAIMQHQQSVTSVETPSDKQEELFKQYTLPVGRSQHNGKTKEELQKEYENAILALKRVQEEMQEAQVQPSVPVAQAHPSWGVVSSSSTMPLTVNQIFPMGTVSQIHPHYTSMATPNAHHGPPNLLGAMNMGSVVNLESEINTAEEPAKTCIGRGRGRIH